MSGTRTGWWEWLRTSARRIGAWGPWTRLQKSLGSVWQRISSKWRTPEPVKLTAVLHAEILEIVGKAPQLKPAAYPEKSRPLEKIFQEIEAELRQQYSIGYTSDRTDAVPGFRAIHVTTKDRSLAVQCRSGYYAEKPRP